MEKRKAGNYVVFARVPAETKKDFQEMCREKGYTESKFVASLLRRELRKWKADGNS